MLKNGMIYYWSPDYSSTVGGVKILYRHVDILNQNGFSSSILHRHNGFRCDWFENTTKVSYIKKVTITDIDYLVIPEVYGSLYTNPNERVKASKIFFKLFNTKAKKIMFNQNSYNTFKGHSFDGNMLKTIYTHRDILATLVVSEDNKQYLEYSFPDMMIFRIHNSINQDMFSYQEEKKKQICFMPRKNMDHALQVINILRLRENIRDFTIIPIEGKSEQETAQILKESLIFLSFGYPEGFSLPPAEAMSCGCIVIGYHGMGGREYFKDDLCFPVEMGDIIAFVKMVEDVINLYRQNPEELQKRAQKASLYIKDNYSKEKERADVLDCWNTLTEI